MFTRRDVSRRHQQSRRTTNQECRFLSVTEHIACSFAFQRHRRQLFVVLRSKCDKRWCVSARRRLLQSEKGVFVDGHFEIWDFLTSQRTCIELCLKVLPEIVSNVQTIAAMILMLLYITEAPVTLNSGDQLCFIRNCVSGGFHVVSTTIINENREKKIHSMKFK